ncbi:MAG: Maf family protein [Phycisphaerales bacterium]
MKFGPPIVLASRSPRRRQLLQEAGICVHVLPPLVDDGEFAPQGQTPQQWVLDMALFKALDVVLRVSSHKDFEAGTVLAADTVCVHRGEILGQPEDAAHAYAMLSRLCNSVHRTISGVCLIRLTDGQRMLFVDEAEVYLGKLSDEAIRDYVQSEQWQGKAGGYNLAERIDASWPIRCEGDPTTVMGLPMQRVLRLLNGVGSGER